MIAASALACIMALSAGQPAGRAQTDLGAQIVQIETDTAAFRNLAPKRDVKEVFITSEQMRERFQASANETDAAIRRRDNIQFWLMRMTDSPDVDILALQTQSSGESVLGFYSPEEKTLYVRNDQPELGPDARMTLAHEFTHALQDQYYDLGKLIRTCNKGVCDSDRALAARALVEGDATLTGLTYAQRRLSRSDLESIFDSASNSDSGQISALPSFLSELAVFPYRDGTEFAIELARRGEGYAAIDRAFRDLPVSTEQIMHPEKYLGRPRDLPKPVALPNVQQALGGGWRMTDNTNLGELGFRAWFAQLGAPRADLVAAGWGGDRFQFFQNGDQAALVIATRWDSENDATEFVANVVDRLGALPKEGEFWRDGARTYALARYKDRIAFIATNDAAAAQTLLQLLGSR